MTVQLDSRTPRALPFAGVVDDDRFVTLNREQGFSGFTFFIHALELESIKPDPAATPMADIDHQSADLHLA
jgi:hypothetical protein